jgi:hypothetical protein
LSLLLLQQLLVDIVAILVKHLLHGMNIIFHLSLCLENSVSIPQILKISPHSSYSCLLSLFAPCAAKVVRIFTFATYFQLLVCFFSVWRRLFAQRWWHVAWHFLLNSWAWRAWGWATVRSFSNLTFDTSPWAGMPHKNLGIPKIGDKKVPSSQIPFFTYKLLAKFCFEACQIRIIRTHPNSSELPNLVIQVTQITKYLVIPLFGSLNNRIFSYSVIWVTQNLVIWVTQRKPKKPNLVINLEVR